MATRPLDVLVRQLQEGFVDLTSGTVTTADLAVAIALVEADIITAIAAVVQDARFHHNQGSALATWGPIAHNLGKVPAVTVVNSANEVVEGAMSIGDLNHVTLTFGAAFAGDAYFN